MHIKTEAFDEIPSEMLYDRLKIKQLIKNYSKTRDWNKNNQEKCKTYQEKL